MTFNIRQLDNLSYDDVEPILDDYIHAVIDEFANSVAGQAHIKEYPEGGGWIATFIEMAYLYGEKTLPKMAKGDVQEVMEYTLPRKLTLLDPSETDDAIPELMAFWTYLKETYKFRSAGAIVKYLRSIETKFGGWMFDPSRGGIAKNFMMQGMEAGHDMSTPEGVAAFQKEHNENIKANPPKGNMPFGGPQEAPMVAPPPDLQAMFDLLGVKLPEEGTMVNPLDLISNIKNALQAAKEGPSFDDDDYSRIDPMRAYALGKYIEEDIPQLSDTDISILNAQDITTSEPGTILKDFEMLLEFIGPNGITVSGKRHQFPMKALADINDRLSKPITLDLKRPQQKSYPPINGLYLLLRATGLVKVVAQGKKHGLVINDEVYNIWKRLNPTERYCTLLEAWLVRAKSEMLGEERSGPFTEGDRCFKSWDNLISKPSLTFPKSNDQERLAYYPGLHNLSLMEMFGFLTITSGKPPAGKGWTIKNVESLPVGKAMMTVYKIALLTNDLTWSSASDPLHPYNELQSFVSPYFPEWQTVLSLPQPEFRPGRHIFKVHLGKCWRRIAIDADASLYTLSRFILDSVDFDYDHLDQFTYKDVMGNKIEVGHPQAEMGRVTTADVKVGDLPIPVGGTMEYVFDFGDWWTFAVQLESIEPLTTETSEAASKSKKGKKSKTAKKTSKRSKRKPQGEIIESQGKAPEQYPSYDDDW